MAAGTVMRWPGLVCGFQLHVTYRNSAAEGEEGAAAGSGRDAGGSRELKDSRRKEVGKGQAEVDVSRLAGLSLVENKNKSDTEKNRI